MSRHFRKIIDLIKAEKQLNMFDSSKDIEHEEPLDASDQDWKGVEDRYDLRKFIEKHGKLKENQFIDLMSLGKPELRSTQYVKDGVSNWAAEHNTPQVLQKVINKLEQSQSEELNFNDRKEAMLETLVNYTNVPEKYIVKEIDKGNENILNNPNFNKNHLYRMAEKHPQHINRYLANQHFDDKLTEKFFSSPEKLDTFDSSTISNLIGRKAKGYNWNNGTPDGPDQSLSLNPRVIHSILEHAPSKLGENSMNILLNHADPTFKKQWIDKALGMSDGVHEHSKPEDYEDGLEDEDFKASNWNNWEVNTFAPHFNPAKRFLPNSYHLDDAQAEHIKRHGEFDQKYGLYHNKHIDPKHGVEMFKKWHDDHVDHGYNSEDLIEKYKEDKDDIFTKDDLDESIIDQIREKAYDNGVDSDYAEEEYSFRDWVQDNIDDLAGKIELSNDHTDTIHDSVREDHDDWTADNPNSIQNINNPTFQALDELHNDYESGFVDLNELKNTTGLDSWESLELTPDDDGHVDMEEVRAKLEEFGGPSKIDFSNHDDFFITDHPDYDERYGEAESQHRTSILESSPYDFYDDFHDDYRESDEYQNASQNAINQYVDENIEDHMDDLYDSSHQDTRFVPDHLHAHIPDFSQLHERNKRKMLDGGEGRFFNEHIKDRDYEHHYGEDQHFYEMVQDHAKANGGSIDVGTMNKLYPSQKEKWKKIFGDKGKISQDEISQKLGELPKTKYDISYGKWDGSKMQNVNDRDQIIFRLDHSSESLKPLMEDPSLYETFKKVQKVSKQSGHPTKDNTIAWARVDTTDPKHWLIDEVQSDFGKTVTRYLKEQGAEEKADHIDKISAHHKNWRESLTNAVLKEARKHGAEKVSTHSPESKASHTGSNTIHSVYKDSYQKVPRQMGFQPTHPKELPLSDSGSEVFTEKDSDKDQLMNKFNSAYYSHYRDSKGFFDIVASRKGKDNTPFSQKARAFAEHHMGMANKHAEKYNQLIRTSKDKLQPYENPLPYHEDDIPFSIGNDHKKILKENSHPIPHEHDELLNQPIPEFKEKSHMGHTYNITPKLLKKHMDDCLEYLEALEKGEMTNAAKGAVLALGLGMGAHYMEQDAKQQAADKFSSGNIPKHARTGASIEEEDPKQLGYEEAKKEANDIFYRNDKKWFLNKYSGGLSPHVYKQTVKNHPELSEKYGYINDLSNRTFKEVIEKNPNLKRDVHDVHYDKLHGEFGGDHEKILHAWKHGIKAAKSAFREPASEEKTLGEQPSFDTVDETVNEAPETPNFTHRRMFKTHR